MNWNGRSIQVLNAHLGLWPLERTRQVQRLHELLDVGRRELTVLMGDLNEWYLWGKSLSILQGVFGQPPAPKTFPATWPLLALDRIWIAPAGAQREVHAHHTAMSLTASDHLPVMAEITLADENRGECSRP
jgi:endonuclease/exonuclease/phosphatase family metal-dependent hydrolase